MKLWERERERVREWWMQTLLLREGESEEDWQKARDTGDWTDGGGRGDGTQGIDFGTVHRAASILYIEAPKVGRLNPWGGSHKQRERKGRKMSRPGLSRNPCSLHWARASHGSEKELEGLVSKNSQPNLLISPFTPFGESHPLSFLSGSPFRQ